MSVGRGRVARPPRYTTSLVTRRTKRSLFTERTKEDETLLAPLAMTPTLNVEPGHQRYQPARLFCQSLEKGRNKFTLGRDVFLPVAAVMGSSHSERPAFRVKIFRRVIKL